MKRSIFRGAMAGLVALSLFCASDARGQNAIVQDLIGQMSIDSMMLYVSELSGELPVDVGNGPQLILSRHKYNPGNAVAQAYIEQKLQQFGYSPVVQSFSATGKNVLVTKSGTVEGRAPVMLCAHYDSMPGGVLDAPGADDNGSGVAALLETARIFQDLEFEHPIIFAFWDEEEQNLVGSAFYAGGIAANDIELRGVINMDAIAYDGNGDTKARIHSRPIGNSHEIADSLFAVRAHYDIDLDLLLTVPGAAYSDHASFWNEGYGAILVIEEFGADGNPFYHTPNDKIEHFDVPYYEKLARLSMATLATLAIPVGQGTGIGRHDAIPTTALKAYPNPVSNSTQVWLRQSIPDRYSITVSDALGKQVMVVYEGILAAGDHSFELDMYDMPAGSYLVRAGSSSGATTLRLIRLP